MVKAHNTHKDGITVSMHWFAFDIGMPGLLNKMFNYKKPANQMICGLLTSFDIDSCGDLGIRTLDTL
jgi:hypothetical protein